MAATADVIRIGQVSTINAEKGTCRVAFDDLQGLVSGDLQIVYPGTRQMQVFWMPEVGESVLCVFLPSGFQEGFVIGSYYTEGNRPVGAREGTYFIRFTDGTFIEYDFEEKKLTSNVAGEADITADRVTVAATEIKAIGNIEVVGNINVTGDVVAGSTSLRNHIHGGVEGGPTTTSPPV